MRTNYYYLRQIPGERACTEKRFLEGFLWLKMGNLKFITMRSRSFFVLLFDCWFCQVDNKETQYSSCQRPKFRKLRKRNCFSLRYKMTLIIFWVQISTIVKTCTFLKFIKCAYLRRNIIFLVDFGICKRPLGVTLKAAACLKKVLGFVWACQELLYKIMAFCLK